MSNELGDIAARNGFSHSAARAALEALRGSGATVQFNNSELGGPGEWTNGTLVIGRVNDQALKDRVAALFAELSPWARALSLEDDPMQSQALLPRKPTSGIGDS